MGWNRLADVSVPWILGFGNIAFDGSTIPLNDSEKRCYR